MKKYILIDLDGTIIDSFKGVTSSIKYALESVGVEVENIEESRKHMGPPLRYTFKNFWNIDGQALELAIGKYRENYISKGMYQHEIYQGIESMIKKLYKQGKKLIVATSKQEEFAKKILEYDGLDKYFIDICGSSADGSRGAKSDVMKYALDKNDITDYKQVLMVGDRYTDIEGAKTLGIEVVGVLYGYGNEEELKSAGADHIVETVKELEELLLNL